MLALPFGDYRDTEQLCCDVISGGLNGGAMTEAVDDAYLANTLVFLIDITEIILLLGVLDSSLIAMAIVCVLTVLAVKAYIECIDLYCAYLCGDSEAGDELILTAKMNAILLLVFAALGLVTKPLLNAFFKSKLVRELGEDLAYRLMNHFDDAWDCYKYIKKLRQSGVTDTVIKEAIEKYGKEGLEFARKAKKYGVTDDIVKIMLGKNSLTHYTDDVLELIGKYPEYADDILRWIDQYGESIADAIATYGDDIVDLFIKHGDEAIDVIADYGDEAVEGLKNGKTPDEIRAKYGKVTSAQRYAELVSGRTQVYGDYSDSYSASQILRQELYDAGVTNPPYKNAAHHLVLWNDPRAAQARKILESYGIHYNAAVNGVLLPMETNAYTGNAALHIGNHSLEYVEYVTEKLQNVADAGGSVDDIVATLNKIREGLLDGTISLN